MCILNIVHSVTEHFRPWALKFTVKIEAPAIYLVAMILARYLAFLYFIKYKTGAITVSIFYDFGEDQMNSCIKRN